MCQKGTAFFLLPFYVQLYVTSCCCFETLLVMASPMLFSHFTYFKSFDTEYCSAFANWQHSIGPRVVSDSSERQLTRDPFRRPPPRTTTHGRRRRATLPPRPPLPSTNPLALSTSRRRASSAPTAASTTKAGGAPLPRRPPTYCWASLLPGI